MLHQKKDRQRPETRQARSVQSYLLDLLPTSSKFGKILFHCLKTWQNNHLFYLPTDLIWFHAEFCEDYRHVKLHWSPANDLTDEQIWLPNKAFTWGRDTTRSLLSLLGFRSITMLSKTSQQGMMQQLTRIGLIIMSITNYVYARSWFNCAVFHTGPITLYLIDSWEVRRCLIEFSICRIAAVFVLLWNLINLCNETNRNFSLIPGGSRVSQFPVAIILIVIVVRIQLISLSLSLIHCNVVFPLSNKQSLSLLRHSH